MKALARAVCACAAILMAASAAAQPTVVYFGRVTGADHVNVGVPGDWAVHIALKRKAEPTPFLTTTSEGDLFACAAPANAEVQIAVHKDGYEGQILDLPSAKDAARVRPDLILEPISPRSVQRLKDPQAFERRLQTEAQIAVLTGRADVFELNVERYKRAAEGRAEFADTVKRFEASQSYLAVIKDPDAPRVPKGTVRYLIGAEDVVNMTPADQKALMDILQSDKFAPSTRRSAVRVVSRVPNLPADMQSTYFDSLRKWARTPESVLFGAAAGVLATRGTQADQKEVARILQSGTAAARIKAIESFEGTLPTPAARAVADVVTTTQDTDLKVTSLRKLKGSSDPEAMKAVAQQTAPTESPAVRMQAVTVLGAATATPETTKALTTVAKTDASPEVRAAAAAALAVKKQE